MVDDERNMERAERMMVRWMCGVRLGDTVPSIELCRRLGIKEVVAAMRRERLRWFGHVECKCE